MPLAIWLAIQLAACLASKVLSVSSSSSRGVVKLSRHSKASGIWLFSARGMGGKRSTLPLCDDALVCARNP